MSVVIAIAHVLRWTVTGFPMPPFASASSASRPPTLALTCPA